MKRAMLLIAALLLAQPQDALAWTKKDTARIQGQQAAEAPTRQPAPAALAETMVTARGQPICADEDGLLAILIGGVSGNRPMVESATGCQYLPAGLAAEILERHPSGSSFMRVIKVKVTAPNRRTITGLTIEIDP
jgi:hypothetical protein